MDGMKFYCCNTHRSLYIVRIDRRRYRYKCSSTQKINTKMRILHCVLILAFAILLTHLSSLPNSLLNYLSSIPKPKARAPPPPPPPPEVTSYILAAQWPPGVCYEVSGVKCHFTPVPTEFKIRGLWPEPKGAPSNESFEPQKITNLTEELDTYWPNLKGPFLNLHFWKYEWKEHGQYSGLGVHEYFEKTLELLKDVGEGLREELVKRNISPSNFRWYNLTDIQKELKDINGGCSCTVVCNQINTINTGKQIQEIQFRYDKDFKMQNNNAPPSGCDPQIRFPALA